MNRRPKVKICGIRRAEDVDFANALAPDYVGFVFAAGSRRMVSGVEALALRARLRPQIGAVGVFVDEEPAAVAAIVSSGAIDAVQLHGREDGAYIASLRRLCRAPLIKAFVVRSRADLDAARESPADFVLLDAGAGDGRAFDWGLLADSGFRRDYFLAGGLGPENVAEAVALLRPFAVDASSSLESGGFKDFAKMERFILEARK